MHQVHQQHRTEPQLCGGVYRRRVGRRVGDPGQHRQWDRGEQLTAGHGADRDTVLAGDHPGHLGTEPDVRARVGRGLRQRVHELAEAAPRVVEHPARSGRVAAQHPRGDLPRGVRGDPATGLLRVDLLARKPPQLVRVRGIERVVDGAAEAAAQRVGVAHRQPIARPEAAQRTGHRVRGDPRRHGGRQRAHQLRGPQREGHPAAGEPQAAVAGTLLQIVAEQAAKIGEDVRRGGRVQPVAPVVHPDPGDLEAPRHPTDRAGSLEHDGGQAGAGGPPCGGQPRRAGAEHDEINAGHRPTVSRCSQDPDDVPPQLRRERHPATVGQVPTPTGFVLRRRVHA